MKRQLAQEAPDLMKGIKSQMEELLQTPEKDRRQKTTRTQITNSDAKKILEQKRDSFPLKAQH